MFLKSCSSGTCIIKRANFTKSGIIMLLILNSKRISCGKCVVFTQAMQRGRAERGGMAALPCTAETWCLDHHWQTGWKAPVSPRVLAASAQQMYSWRTCSFLCFAILFLYGMSKPVQKLLAPSTCVSCTGWKEPTIPYSSHICKCFWSEALRNYTRAWCWHPADSI